ncbi:hypothetical protein K488DRAFT_22092, partial [Vararia minispora EC-137]
VVNPVSGGSCAAGQLCTVQWVDNGVAPTLTSIGVCTIGLYHGTQQLVQSLDPVNVASTVSLTFTPQANAGPNSGNYYVAFTSTSYKVNGTFAYVGFSPDFFLTGMTGSFNSPVAVLTSTRAVPASLSSAAVAATGNVPVSTLSHTATISVSSARSPTS